MSALLDGARLGLLPEKLLALAAVWVALVCLVQALGRDQRGRAALREGIRTHREALRSLLRRAGEHWSVNALIAAQVVLALAGPVLALSLRKPVFLGLFLLALLGPKLWLTHAAKKRVDRIEQKLDVFGVLLANALRASPSIGRAFAQIADNAPTPINEEIHQLLRELHVGSTLEQALLNMSVRVGSFQLDTLLSGLLIGRRIGGNVPEVLDTAAATIREMHRLEGVLAAKTSEGRVQSMMLGAMPVAVVFLFDRVKPGYFDVLTTSPVGIAVSLSAVGMWLFSVVAARRILEVQL